MRVTPKISDRPAATRKSAEASASPLINWTSRLGSIFAWRRVGWGWVVSGDRYTGNVFGLQGFLICGLVFCLQPRGGEGGLSVFAVGIRGVLSVWRSCRSVCLRFRWHPRYAFVLHASPLCGAAGSVIDFVFRA